MIRRDLVNTLQQHCGPIFVQAMHPDCTLWIQIVKSDFAEMLCGSFGAMQETQMRLDKDGYICVVR